MTHSEYRRAWHALNAIKPEVIKEILVDCGVNGLDCNDLEKMAWPAHLIVTGGRFIRQEEIAQKIWAAARIRALELVK